MLNHVLFQPCTLGGTTKWYESGDKARVLLEMFPSITFSHLEWQSYAWPGGYEIVYVVQDGGVLCHQCANKELMRTLDPDDSQFHIVGDFINYEDTDLFCDHCNRKIGPEYVE